MEFTKVVKIKMDGLKAQITIDSDQDGQPALSATIDLPEVVAESLGLFKKPAPEVAE
jgi:hypothetical protein